jgi:hypothetical protein
MQKLKLLHYWKAHRGARLFGWRAEAKGLATEGCLSPPSACFPPLRLFPKRRRTSLDGHGKSVLGQISAARPAGNWTDNRHSEPIIHDSHAATVRADRACQEERWCCRASPAGRALLHFRGIALLRWPLSLRGRSCSWGARRAFTQGYAGSPLEQGSRVLAEVVFFSFRATSGITGARTGA